MIKKKSLDSSRVERQIISQMILNTHFLSRISKVYKRNALKMPFTNTIAELCVDYYNEYKKAPGKHIQSLYDNIVRIDPDQKELIRTFLISINNEIQNTPEDKLQNTDYHLKLATDHLTHIKVSKFRDDLDNAIAGKEYQKIEAMMKGFKSVTHQVKKSRGALKDVQFAIDSYQADKEEVLFMLPGEIGKMIGPIRRGGYYVIQAATGIGKSWFLEWISMHSALSGIETALTPLEMKDTQSNLRIQHMLLGKCLYKEQDDFVYAPIWDCHHNQTGECQRHYDAIATKKENNQNQNKFDKNKKPQVQWIIPTSKQYEQYKNHLCCTQCMGRPPISSAPGFKVSTWYKKIKVDYATSDKTVNYLNRLSQANQINADIHINDFPRNSLSPDDYAAYIHNLFHYEGHLIDVGIIDYSNEMKKKENLSEKQGIDEIHGSLKNLAQERNIAIISANQSNDEGLLYGSRKIGHLIDGGIKISQTNYEKARGYYRVETLKQRFGKGQKGNVLYITQCLELGKPIVEEYWDVNLEE